MDQGKAYHQGFLTPESQPLTAFITPWGLILDTECHGSRRVVLSSDLETEKLAESLLRFVTDDGPSFCESNGENSLHAIDILFGNFCYKKDKLKSVGSLQDLKAFVLTEVDEEIAESTT